MPGPPAVLRRRVIAYMRSKKELLLNSLLYVLIDRQVCADRDIVPLAEELRDAGAGLVQLRDKVSPRERVLDVALSLRRVFAGSGTLFILNDHADIALRAGCDGVHLGQNDTGIADARRLLGAGALIGISCFSAADAVAAQGSGADYLGIGPVFPTGTKECSRFCGTAAAAAVKPLISVPFFLIGGITTDNLPGLLSAGAERVAVCSAVIRAADPAEEVRRFTAILKKGLEDDL